MLLRQAGLPTGCYTGAMQRSEFVCGLAGAFVAVCGVVGYAVSDNTPHYGILAAGVLGVWGASQAVALRAASHRKRFTRRRQLELARSEFAWLLVVSQLQVACARASA